MNGTDIVPEVRRSAIQSLLDFFHDQIDQRREGYCKHRLFEVLPKREPPEHYDNLNWFYGSPIVGELQQLRDFQSRTCNSLVIGDIFRYLGGVGKVLPKEAEGMPLSVEELAWIMKSAFAVSSNGSLLLPGHERCGVAEAFELSHSDLIEE
jgi:hypothetical protein